MPRWLGAAQLAQLILPPWPSWLWHTAATPMRRRQKQTQKPKKTQPHHHHHHHHSQKHRLAMLRLIRQSQRRPAHKVLNKKTGALYPRHKAQACKP
jgi:hypothetical protein